MVQKCHYCEAVQVLETLRDPASGVLYPACDDCVTRLKSAARRMRFLGWMRLSGSAALVILAIQMLISGNWHVSVFSSIAAGIVAGLDL